MNKIKLKYLLGLLAFAAGFLLLLSFEEKTLAAQPGNLHFHFNHIANGRTIERDSTYYTAFGETYQISKLKYYISNIKLDGFEEKESYHLLNAFDEKSFNIPLPPGTYKSLQFLIGVDSIRNCTGAQTGALDPLNDMFWTWNNGYVMFKLEGTSAQSTVDLNRIEHHIGGYKGPYKTMRLFNIRFSYPLVITAGQQQDLLIEMNMDKYWQGTHNTRISELPLLMITGEAANRCADNIIGMFSFKSYTQ